MIGMGAASTRALRTNGSRHEEAALEIGGIDRMRLYRIHPYINPVSLYLIAPPDTIDGTLINPSPSLPIGASAASSVAAGRQEKDPYCGYSLGACLEREKRGNDCHVTLSLSLSMMVWRGCGNGPALASRRLRA